MDLALKPEHKAFADEVRAFARANLSPATKAKTFSGKHYDKDDHIQWQKALGRQGWLAYTWPRKYGGPGWDVTQRFLFENVLAEGTAGASTHLLDLLMLVLFGAQERTADEFRALLQAAGFAHVTVHLGEPPWGIVEGVRP